MSLGSSSLNKIDGSRKFVVNSSSMTFRYKSSALHILDLLKDSIEKNDGRSFNFYMGSLNSLKHLDSPNRPPIVPIDLLLLQKEFYN